jgi:hypothetical protein
MARMDEKPPDNGQAEERIVEIIRDVYQRPYLYGQTAIELDVTLRNYHWFWALLHGAESRLNTVTLEATPIGRRSAAGSFSRIFRLAHPSGDEAAELSYVCEMWQQISSTLGILAP